MPPRVYIYNESLATAPSLPRQSSFIIFVKKFKRFPINQYQFIMRARRESVSIEP